MFFSVLMGISTLGFLRPTQYLRRKKKVQQNKLMKAHEAYLSLSHLVNGVLLFISKSSEKPNFFFCLNLVHAGNLTIWYAAYPQTRHQINYS